MKLSEYLTQSNLSQTAFGEMLGVTQSAVSQWIDRDIVPADHCPKIERITNGMVRCEEMNDKVDWAYIRSQPFVNRRKSEQRNSDRRKA